MKRLLAIMLVLCIAVISSGCSAVSGHPAANVIGTLDKIVSADELQPTKEAEKEARAARAAKRAARISAGSLP